MSDNKVSSSQQEHMIASFLDWKVVSGSGARPTAVGDVEGEEYIGECKTHNTSDHKISFNKQVWLKIAAEAASRYKRPVLFVDNGSKRPEATWVLTDCPPQKEGHKHIQMPIKFRTNINFRSDDMYDKLYEFTGTLFDVVCSTDKFEEGKTVYICNLHTFKDYFTRGDSYVDYTAGRY